MERGNNVLIDKNWVRGLKTTICAINENQIILNAVYTFSWHYNDKDNLAKNFPDWTCMYMT